VDLDKKELLVIVCLLKGELRMSHKINCNGAMQMVKDFVGLMDNISTVTYTPWVEPPNFPEYWAYPPTISSSSYYLQTFDFIQDRLEECEDAFVLHIDAPSLIKGTIEATIERDTIIINAKYKESKGKFLSNARLSNDFSRTINDEALRCRGLKDTSVLNYDKTSIDYVDGEILLSIPKKESHKPRKITVK
jgi:hypothetical protein